jgi:RimJ/RimL family protein N-acetyltransferase
VISEAQLRDGTPALIWELLPSDREALRTGYEELSEETRYHRFLTGVPHLTPHLLDHLVDDVDNVDHVALAIVVIDDEGVGTPVGVGRIIRYADQPDAADIAVTVLDDWQGRGAATALIEELLRRRPEGVTRILTTVAADNPASLAMLRRLGPTTETPGESPRVDIEVQLSPMPSPPAEPADARVEAGPADA